MEAYTDGLLHGEGKESVYFTDSARRELNVVRKERNGAVCKEIALLAEDYGGVWEGADTVQGESGCMKESGRHGP